jgi:hypothetical protein
MLSGKNHQPVAQLVETLRYKLEDRGFYSPWGYLDSSLIQSFRLWDQLRL